jgi:hypothetical protein
MTGIWKLNSKTLHSFLCTMQGVFGVLVPVTLGYWREMKDRSAFAQRHGVPLKRSGWRCVLFQLAIVYATVLFSVGIMTQIFLFIPELARLPIILHGRGVNDGQL